MPTNNLDNVPEPPWSDALGHLRNEMDYQKQVGSKTGAAALEYALADIARLRAALERSIIALDDWLHQYAGELCDEKHVEESLARIYEYGTIGYITGVQQQNRDALERVSDD